MVVLVHGIASASISMWPLSWHLRKNGFETECFGYPSCRQTIQFHGRRFAGFLEKLHQTQRCESINIVAHSLGGIVTRSAIADHGLPFINRIVTLATPHKGSATAAWLTSHGLGFIKTLAEISDAGDSFVNGLCEIESFEVGAITASYDFVVGPKSSAMRSVSDHIKVFSGHNGLLVRPKVGRYVTSFLKTGKFQVV